MLNIFKKCFFYCHFFTSSEYFTTAKVCVTASLQDTSQYSSKSQQCFSQNGLDSFSEFHLFIFSLQSFLTVPSAPTTIVINIPLMFNSFFFNSLATPQNLYFYSGTTKYIRRCSFFFDKIRWFICFSRSYNILYDSFSDSGSCIYNYVVRSKFNILNNFHWITYPAPSFRVLYTFCVSMLFVIVPSTPTINVIFMPTTYLILWQCPSSYLVFRFPWTLRYARSMQSTN